MHACIYACMYVRTYVCILCINVSMYLCICASVHLCICASGICASVYLCMYEYSLHQHNDFVQQLINSATSSQNLSSILKRLVVRIPLLLEPRIVLVVIPSGDDGKYRLVSKQLFHSISRTVKCSFWLKTQQSPYHPKTKTYFAKKNRTNLEL